MGRVNPVTPVKLICGFIFNSPQTYSAAQRFMEARFGKSDYESPLIEFNYTDYYQQEFGTGLKRRFLSFERLIKPSELAGIKIYTNKLEKKFSHSERRKINIDPGYMTMAKLILATTKDYCHRIYLDKGIYAEVTLFYRDKMFQPSDWTYTDYRTREYLQVFENIRVIYEKQLFLGKKHVKNNRVEEGGRQERSDFTVSASSAHTLTKDI